MRAKGTWVTLFFFVSALIVAVVLNMMFRDIFSWIQVDNRAILGDNFRLSTLVGGGIALILAIFFGVIYKKSRVYIEQCVSELDKVAWPTFKETKTSTFTVIVTSIVASIILGVFDTVFSWLTKNNLFIW